MAITASSVLASNSLEDFRIEFNNLVTDVNAIQLANTFDTRIIFEGSTVDGFETALTLVDPTADRSIVLPNVSGNLIVDGNPISANGESLGTASLEWSDAFFADGSILYFGDDQDVTLTHVADTGLRFQDNDKMLFGAGSDLQIFHENVGNTGQIQESGAGGLYIKSDGALIGLQKTGGEEMANFNTDGSVQLYYDNVLKFATSSAGGTLTGTWEVTTALVPDASDGAALGTTALEWSDLFLADGAVINFGDDQDVTLTHVADTGLLLNSTMKLQFNDASQFIHAPSATVLDIAATDEIELTATEVEMNVTTVDINGNVDISGTTLMTGVATHGGNVVSDTDSTDDLGTTGVRWANLYVDAITATDQITATGFTGTLDGILGSGSAAAATTTTLASTTITASGIIKTDDTTAATSTTDGSLQTDGGLSVALDAVIGDDLIMLSDASVIHFGADSDITVTHVHNTGLTVKNTGTGDAGMVLNLVTGDTAVTANNVLGEINFAAPDESSGTDAILNGARIIASAEGTFAADNNATKLSFQLGVSEAPSEKMSLSSAGLLTIADDLVIKTGGTIGGANDTDLLTLTSGVLTVAGELDAATLDISGNADIDGTTNLDAVDIDGAVQIDATLSVGVDDQGYDVKFFGDTASAYMLWDTSADDLILGGGARLGVGTTSPSYLIHQVQAGADTAAEIQTTGGAYGAELRLNSGGSSPAAYVTGRGSGTENWRVGSNSQGNTLELKTGANAVSHFTFDASGAVYNDDSVDLDFRVESNGNANMLFVDGGNDRVGIGTAPAADMVLDVNGQIKAGNTGASLDTEPGGFGTFIQTTSTGQCAVMAYSDGGAATLSLHSNTGAAAVVENIRMTPSVVTVNEGSLDMDFRVESNGNANMLFVDGGNDRVGIGTAAPNTNLDVIGSSTGGSGAVDTIRLRHTGTTVNDGPRLQFTAGTSTSGAAIASQGKALNSADLLFYAGGNTERMRIDVDGKVGFGATPGAPFDFRTGLASHSQFTINASTTAGSGAGGAFLKFHGSNAASAPQIAGIDGSMTDGTDGSESGILAFFTTNSGTSSEKMRLLAGGTLVIGAATANATASLIELRTAANTALNFYMLKASQVEMSMGFKASTDTNFYIGTGTTAVGTNGVYLANTGTSWVSNSDFRKKKNLSPIENALDKIANCRAVTGHFKHEADDVKKRPFLIAQDWVTALPEAVDQDTVDDDGVENLGLSYEGTVPLLVAAIKELREQNIALTSRITTLEG